MYLKKLVGCVRKADADYKMISEGDHIVVGASGGKDSIALLTALSRYRTFSQNKFTLSAVHIDLGFPDTDRNQMKAFCDYIEGLGIELHIVKSQIGEILFDLRKEDNPCSLCSKLRRGALNTKVLEIGANKLALGHHNDDVLETVMLSFIYEGRLSCFQPLSYMDRTGVTLIRPFIYAYEKDIKSAVKKYDMPIVENPCPANHVTQREYMKKLIKSIDEDIPGAKERMMAAVTHPERNNLWEKP